MPMVAGGFALIWTDESWLLTISMPCLIFQDVNSLTDNAHSKARKVETTHTAKPERLNKQDWTTRGASEITT